ncbi:hypothetical protein PEP31012_04538 [Pandoraea eparura]|uniref:Uncharacterized protein n=2 Tax=Pandoraea eparura TaxID=2508291 RepID=A0A5E4YGN3_9BURK|nr:hypothetical protein PEP31012_04538 [Pandoraea eparura]
MVVIVVSAVVSAVVVGVAVAVDVTVTASVVMVAVGTVPVCETLTFAVALVATVLVRVTGRWLVIVRMPMIVAMTVVMHLVICRRRAGATRRIRGVGHGNS